MNFQTRYLWIIFPSILLGILLFSISAIPMQDFPLHVFFASILSDGSPLFPGGQPIYSTSLTPKSYVGVFWLWWILSTFMSHELGGRLIVFAYIVLSVIAATRLIKKNNPECPYGAAVAIGWWIPFSFFYYMGFIQYLFIIPILLFLITDVLALLNKPETPFTTTKIFCELILLYLLHPYGIGFGLICLVPLIKLLAGKSSRLTTRKQAAFLLITGSVLFVIAVSSVFGPVKTGLVDNLKQQSTINPFTQSSKMKDAFLLAARVPIGPLKGVAKYIQFIALGCLSVTISLSLLLKNTDFSSRKKNTIAAYLFISSIILFIITVYVSGKQESGMLFHRLFIFPYFLFLISWSLIANFKKYFLYILLALSSILHLSAVATAHVQFHFEAKPGRSILDIAPENATILPLLFDRDSEIVKDEFVHVYQHITAFHPAKNGGIYLLCRRAPPNIVVPMLPINYYPQLARPWSFEWNFVSRKVDYVFLRAPKKDVISNQIMNTAFRRVLSSLDAERQFIKKENRWAIWGPS